MTVLLISSVSGCVVDFYVDMLGVVAEVVAEKVQAAYILRIRLDTDAEQKVVFFPYPQRIRRVVGNPDAVANKWCTQDGDQPNNLFSQGKLMFLPEGTWVLSTVEYTGLNYGETYMITYDTENMVQWASSHQFVMPRNEKMTDEKAAAIMDFINYVG